VELDPKSVGDLITPPGPRFQITKHLNLANLAQRAKLFRGCFEFDVLKVELALQRVGDLIVPSGPQFQINNHLNLAILAKSINFFCGCFEGGIGPPTRGGPHNSTGAPISNHQTSKFSSKSQIFLWVF
jgi:hypothetical protein